MLYPKELVTEALTRVSIVPQVSLFSFNSLPHKHYQVQAIIAVHLLPGFLGQIRPVLALTVLSRSAKVGAMWCSICVYSINFILRCASGTHCFNPKHLNLSMERTSIFTNAMPQMY